MQYSILSAWDKTYASDNWLTFYRTLKDEIWTAINLIWSYRRPNCVTFFHWRKTRCFFDINDTSLIEFNFEKNIIDPHWKIIFSIIMLDVEISVFLKLTKLDFFVMTLNKDRDVSIYHVMSPSISHNYNTIMTIR